MGKKTVQVFPKHVIEGMFAEFIASLKNSLDCCYYPKMLAETKLTPLQSIKATYGISKGDSEEVIEKLKPYTDASLCSKHRYMRDIIEEFIDRLDGCENIAQAKRTTHRGVRQFAKEITVFLVNAHRVMHEDTPEEQRVEIVTGYTGECLELARRLPGKSKDAGMILDISAKSI